MANVWCKISYFDNIKNIKVTCEGPITIDPLVKPSKSIDIDEDEIVSNFINILAKEHANHPDVSKLKLISWKKIPKSNVE